MGVQGARMQGKRGRPGPGGGQEPGRGCEDRGAAWMRGLDAGQWAAEGWTPPPQLGDLPGNFPGASASRGSPTRPVSAALGSCRGKEGRQSGVLSALLPNATLRGARNAPPPGFGRPDAPSGWAKRWDPRGTGRLGAPLKVGGDRGAGTARWVGGSAGLGPGDPGAARAGGAWGRKPGRTPSWGNPFKFWVPFVAQWSPGAVRPHWPGAMTSRSGPARSPFEGGLGPVEVPGRWSLRLWAPPWGRPTEGSWLGGGALVLEMLPDAGSEMRGN